MALEIPGYQIEREVGRGGMARVHLAVQNKFGRLVALKVVSAEYSKDPNFRKRFVRESRINAQLSHPHIVQVYDVGVHENYLYLVMEYMRGGDLTQRLNRGMHMQELLQVIRDIARALDFAHGKGFVHRDIKPENILFREDGSAVLSDFGIAKVVGDGPNITRMGTVVGTPQYMSPEQAAGKELDGRSDIYSLGVVFFRMLSGDVPYRGDSAVAVGIRHLQDPIPKLPNHLSAFQTIIDKILAKKVDERYQSGEDIINDLDDVRSEGLVPNTVVRADAVSTDEIEAIRSTVMTAVRGDTSAIRAEPKSRRKRRRPGFVVGVSAVLALATAATFVATERPELVQRAISALGLGDDQALSEAWSAARSMHNDPNQSLAAVVAGYRRVLQIAPGYTDAESAIAGLERQWRDQITAAIDANDLVQAQNRLAEALSAFPKNVELSGFITVIADRERAESLLRSTEGLLRSHGVADVPSATAAIQAYQEVLRLAPGNAEAVKALDDIASFYAQRAIETASTGDTESAIALLDRASAANPDLAALQDVRLSIADATSMQGAIDEMLSAASAYRAAGELINPPGENAAEMYHRVLSTDPDNAIAQQGLSEIEAQISSNAAVLIEAGDLAAVRALVDRASAVGLQGTVVNDLKSRLEDEQARLGRVDQLITEAANLFDAGYITGPTDSNAVSVLREVVTLDPGNVRAQSLLAQCASRLAAVAQEAWESGLAADARYYLDLALTVTPDVAEWRRMREQWNNEAAG